MNPPPIPTNDQINPNHQVPLSVPQIPTTNQNEQPVSSTPVPAVPIAQQPVSVPPTPAQSTGTPDNEQPSYSPIFVVGSVNFPATQLFEATGFVDLDKQYPTGNAFLLFVPGARDASKQSGRTYNYALKETMKVSVRDLYALSEALIWASTYGSSDFKIFTDSSKFSGTAAGAGQTKQVSVGTAQGNDGKPKIFLNYRGRASVSIPLTPDHARGLAKELLALGDEVSKAKFWNQQQSRKNYTN